MSFNYQPVISGYSGQRPFRFWCQTVLPLVYDDSLSYYELLNKVVVYLNNTINDVSAVESNVSELLNAYNALQNYINSYFDNLDVQEEINNKLDAMAENGDLDPIVARVINAIVTIDAYSDYVEGDDWTLALQTAINENGYVVVNHDINIYGTVNIPDSKAIRLLGCRVIKPVGSETGPIFEMNGSYSALTGIGPASVVRSYVESPDGVIKVGAKSNTIIEKTCIYCQVSDLTVRGVADAGSNAGIHLCGTFDSETYYASYFHNISNVVVHSCAYGILFNNASNGNIVTNIQFYGCGYNLTTGALVFMRTQGEYSVQRIPLENTIANIFHHASENATTICILTTIGLNRLDNIVCEQGGANSHLIYFDPNERILTLSRNIINYTDNSNAGVNAPADFRVYNTLQSQGTMWANNVVVNGRLELKGMELRADSGKTIEIRNVSGMTEGTDYTVGHLANGSATTGNASAIVRVYASTQSPSIPLITRVRIGQYWAKWSGSGAPTVTTLGDELGTLACTIAADGTMTLRIVNNGTATTNAKCDVIIEIKGYYPGDGFVPADGFEVVN